MACGANSVHVVQAITKKGRLEYLFFVDANSEDVERLAAYLAPIGLIAQTEGEPVRATVRVKEILDKDQVISRKAEYEDLKLALAQFERAGLPISYVDLKGFVEQAATGQGSLTLRGIQVEHPTT